jgi:predicted dehydrogenase
MPRSQGAAYTPTEHRWVSGIYNHDSGAGSDGSFPCIDRAARPGSGFGAVAGDGGVATLVRAAVFHPRRKAAAAGLLLGSAPDTFLGPGLQTVRRLIEAGAVGTPLTASVVMQYGGPHRWHPNPDFLYLAGAGPLFDMGPYYLTALTQTFGAVTQVAARSASAGPTRIIAKGPRAGEEIAVAVATYVAALYDFDNGCVAQATFSFDSPMQRTGVVEFAGTEATILAPDPNTFTGEVRINRGGPEWESIRTTGVEGGRGIGAVEMARAIRAGRQHRATGRLALHILDAMFATTTSAETAAFVAVNSRFEPIPALPEDWDPTARTL